MIKKEIKEKDSKIIEVDASLIEVLEKLRAPINDFTWGVVGKDMSWRLLTKILAEKIKQRGI
jgi:uncharacterized protein YejL (UPF0352 family)